ncbi:HAD-IIIC family phosphatase [Lentzea jiangxiensis]|uniref:HAD-superfamily phosphatase, subfamily IIIC/FkbH-like domain-containing protein n=1 Tax=Lentzea jiangxiensis TaxID=641025 RepID=A0A1H0SFH2_9PSEU|nr:HAD-IIIC family phosphatase [Lentzea jiangxiensis]SDP40440.1 HAD-superfamily phosphatase, subfamily IIIC/FkbH-like domain-containing protein [Lentzea jiangxiensis]
METKEVLARIRRLTTPGAEADPALLGDLAALTDLPALLEAGRLLGKVPAELLGTLRPLKVAITGTFTASGVAPLLRVALLGRGIAPEIHVSGFDQLAVDLSSPDSPLAAFNPQVTLCLLHDDWFVPAEWDDAAAFESAVRGRWGMFDNLVGAFTERSGSAVLVHTVPLSPVEMRGVVAFDGRAALGRAWRELNSDLLGMALRRDQVHALDLEAYLVDAPARLRDERLYRFASAAWTPEVEQVYATEAAHFCRAFLGLAKKVLVLDLDNTLWGGVVGDDGPSGIQIGSMYPGNAFREMQRRAVQLRKQGVVLALASKNEAAIVDEVLNDHPDLVIRPADIAARAVNWQPKDHNIRGLAAQLNLGLDSFVFADDSTFETQLVRGSIPEVTVVHLDGDPADHVTALQRTGSFDVLTTTATDRERTGLYKARAERTEFADSFSSVQDYLRGLEITVSVREADEFSLPRLVQLGQRTNQFNMIGTSHAEARTREMAASGDHVVLVFEVADRFGAEGIVGGVWVSKHDDHWLVENFVMSCRVFTRGVEHTVVQHLADRALSAGAVRLEADFRATDRNKAAAAFYPDAGFERVSEGRFTLPLLPRPQIGPEWTTLVVERESADV